MTFEEAEQVRIACLDHAEELLVAAESLVDTHPHLTYHLTTLALEEIGKTVQVFIEALPVQRPISDKPIWADRDDHVQKLFWALWNPWISQESIQPDHLNWCRDFSKEIHQLRLGGLYVDWQEGHLSKPRDVINRDRAVKLLDLAKVRLNLARMEKLVELDGEKRSLLSWFTSAAWDEEKAKLIFGKKSLAKLAEFQNSPDWFKWLREQFIEAEQEAQHLLKQELARTKPGETERAKPKWEVKIRLYTPSHSVRQTELNWVNQIGNLLRLDRGKDHTELFLTMALPKAVPLQGLWHTGWAESRRFVAALNIGSLGFFWWQIPTAVSRYYTRILDLDTNYEVRMERVPRLTLDWGNRVLDRTALFHVLMAYRFLPRDVGMNEEGLLAEYLNGLACMGGNDIHLRLEASAVLAFYNAFRTALRHYGDWDEKVAFLDAAKVMFQRDFPDYSDWQEFLGLGEALKTGPPPTQEITLTHVGGMKLYCDSYIIKNIKAMASKEKVEATASPETKV